MLAALPARLGLQHFVFLGVLTQVAASATYYWPLQKGNVNRTGYSPYAVTNTFTVGPTWVWKDPNLNVIRCTPLIDDKKNIYLGTQAGWLYKFSPDGAMLWSYKSRRGNTPTVSAIMDGSVYLNTAYGYVVALDMETGKERWATAVSGSTAGDTACILALNGTVISATRQPGTRGNNNMVVAVNPNGSLRWTFKHDWPTFNFQASAPGDGTIIFQDHFGGLYRLGLEDGGLIWESGIRLRNRGDFTTGAAVVGPNGLVYVSSNYFGQGLFHAYRLSDGAQVWTKDAGMPVNQAVAYGVIAGSDKPAVVAGIGENPGYPASFHAQRILPFAPNWLLGMVNELSIRMGGKPTWLWGTKALPAALVALEADTGMLRWSYNPPPFFKPSCEGDESSLNIRLTAKVFHPDYSIDEICLPDDWAQAVIGGDGTTYAGFQDGKLYAVRDVNGNQHIEDSEVSTYYFNHAFQGSQGIAPGMLAVAPCGGGLYVWKS